MSKLFVFGDSHAYGHGLADCWDGPKTNGAGPLPSKLAWPSLLGDMLGREVINLSKPGLSNKGIVHQLRLNKQQISSDDVVCIGWSYIERHMIITYKGRNNINDCNHLGPWKIRKNKAEIKSRLYYKHISLTIDAAITTSWYIEFSDLLIKKIGARIVHFPVPNSTPPTETVDIADDIIYSNADLQEYIVDIADDNVHGGPKSHKKFAEVVMDVHGDYLK